MGTRVDTETRFLLHVVARACNRSCTLPSPLMGYARKLPSGRWQAGYRDAEGKQRSAGTHDTKRAALAAAALAEGAAPAKKAEQITWGDWERDGWTRQVEASTLAADESRLANHLRPRWADTPLTEMNRADIQTWLDSLDCAATTKKKLGHLLSASMKAAMIAGLVDSNPCVGLKYPKPDPSPQRWLSVAEIEAVRAVMPAEYVELFNFLIGTGVRWAEAAGAHWDQIDLDRATFTVRWSLDRSGVFKAPKSGKPRIVPLGASLVAELSARLERNGLGESLAGATFTRGNRPLYGLVFTSPTGRPVESRRFALALSAAGKAAKVNGKAVGHIRPHDLRHSYASALVQKGVGLDTVQALLGHSSVVVTQRYADAAQSQWGAVRDVLG